MENSIQESESHHENVYAIDVQRSYNGYGVETIEQNPDGYRAPMEQPTWKVTLWRFMTSSQANNVRANLRNFEIPVFVITGDNDVIIRVEDTFRVTERIPGHSIYVVPNASHLAHEEHPDDFMSVVRKFIERVSPSDTSRSST